MRARLSSLLSSSSSLHAVQIYAGEDGKLISNQQDRGDFNSEMPKETLSIFERLGRAAQFYSKALPVFISYLTLDAKFKATGAYNVDEVPPEVEDEWQQLHDWGSDEISKAITQLKGFNTYQK